MTTERCIIIPAFNEEKNIASVIEGIKKNTDADVIVIDDGSRDATVDKARNAGALVISHPFNMGYGVALQTGYKYASAKRYRYLVQIDGDGQHDPRHIPELFRQLEEGSCDVAIGSRYLVKGGYQPGILKTLGTALFRFIIRTLTGERITDPTSGYQGLSRDVFEFFTDDGFPCDYPDANIIILLHRQGYRMKEISVAMRPNPEGRSMHRGFSNITYYFFRIFLSILVTMLKKNYSKRRKK